MLPWLLLTALAGPATLGPVPAILPPPPQAPHPVILLPDPPDTSPLGLSWRLDPWLLWTGPPPASEAAPRSSEALARLRRAEEGGRWLQLPELRQGFRAAVSDEGLTAAHPDPHAALLALEAARLQALLDPDQRPSFAATALEARSRLPPGPAAHLAGAMALWADPSLPLAAELAPAARPSVLARVAGAAAGSAGPFPADADLAQVEASLPPAARYPLSALRLREALRRGDAPAAATLFPQVQTAHQAWCAAAVADRWCAARDDLLLAAEGWIVARGLLVASDPWAALAAAGYACALDESLLPDDPVTLAVDFQDGRLVAGPVADPLLACVLTTAALPPGSAEGTYVLVFDVGP